MLVSVTNVMLLVLLPLLNTLRSLIRNEPGTFHAYIYIYIYIIILGKGTQCQLLSERLKTQEKSWVHLSAGDLLRAERAKGSDHSTLAKEINQYIDAGQLVPSHITCQLLINAMMEAYNQSSSNNSHQQQSTVTHFLIDGFPRSQNNLEAWNTMTTINDGSNNTTTSNKDSNLSHTKFTYHVQFVLNYTCPEETLIGRILERGKTQSRTDDNITTIQARFRTFDKETKPILDYYQKRYTTTAADTDGTSGTTDTTKVPVYTIPTDQPVEAVYQQTIQYF